MNTLTRHRFRVESTRSELDTLGRDIAGWLERWHDGDVDVQGRYVGRHKTQHEAIAALLGDAGRALARSLDAVAESAGQRPTVELYEDCRDHDRAIVWLRRVWRYFADRIDPRSQDADTGALLRAADEVIWSCHRGVFQRALARQAGLAGAPAPLPFLAPDYSPAALEADRPLPSELQATGGLPAVDDAIARLPVPLLRLPSWCLRAPWSLVFVGHEVGHHLQHDLRLVRFFAEGLEGAVRGAGGAAAAERWKGWGEEIFADLVSLLVMGPAALWAISELEWAPRRSMLRPGARYPAPALRLKLMIDWAARVGLAAPPADVAALLAEALAAPLPPVLDVDLALVPKVLDFARGPMDGDLGTLEQLCGFDPADFAPGSACLAWAARLVDPGALPPIHADLRSPRLLAAALALAWWAAREIDDAAERDRRRALLRARALDLLPRCGPPGVRAALQPAGARAGAGEALAGELLAASRAQRDREVADADPDRP